MRLDLHVASILPLACGAYSAACPPLGPVFPAPTNLSNSISFQQALSNLTYSLDVALDKSNSSFGKIDSEDTYSIQVFSGSSHKSIFEYYHHGENLTNSSATTIDGDTVYRIGSVSKLFSVYMLLVEAGDQIFAEPLSKYLPELRGKVTWQDVTIGAVAAHLSGIEDDVIIDHNIAQLKQMGTTYSDAYPALEPEDEKHCASNSTHCSRSQFFKALESSRSTYEPNTTPVYSNTGYVLLGYVLESITGTSFNNALAKIVTEPLDLRRTTALPPDSSHVGAIKHNETFSWWNFDLSDTTAEGGIFSSANDMSNLGRAILNATQLSLNTTRGWMKPAVLTSSLRSAVGRPWEIWRTMIGDPANNRVVDLYTKGGTIGVYQSIIAFIPDFNIGYNILISSENQLTQYTSAGILSDILVPALEEAAREEANAAFSGTYMAAGALNSSVVVSSDSDSPGLTLDRWISNGTDMLRTIDPKGRGFRLFWSNADASNRTLSAWKAEPNSLAMPYGLFGGCASWLGIGTQVYGKYSTDDFVFTLGDDGKAKSLAIKALKVVLERQ